jgi:hypothetical protein
LVFSELSFKLSIENVESSGEELPKIEAAVIIEFCILASLLFNYN